MENFVIHDFLGWRLGVIERIVTENPGHSNFPSSCKVLVGKDAIIFELPSAPSYATVSRFDLYDYPLVNLVSIAGFAASGRFTPSEAETIAFAPVSSDPFVSPRIASTSVGEAVCFVADFMPNGLAIVELDAILLRFMDETVERVEQLKTSLELVGLESKQGSFSRGVGNKLSDIEIETLTSVRALAKRPKVKLPHSD